MNLYIRQFETPYGKMIAAIDEGGALTRLIFPNEHTRWADELVREGMATLPDAGRCDNVLRQLDAYFQGTRRTFELPVRPSGTPFQQAVWAALMTIPYGTTTSYKTLAERIGKPAAVRAVGRANGTNRIPIIIPCHRVIGADGSLTGFGGGLALKEALLTLEGVQVQRMRPTVQQLALL